MAASSLPYRNACIASCSSILATSSSRVAKFAPPRASSLRISKTAHPTSLFPQYRPFLSSAFFPERQNWRLSKNGLCSSPYRVAVSSAATQIASLPLGSPAPDFELPEPLTGKIWKLEDFNDVSCLWVMFLCNRSHSLGYFKAHLAKLARDYIPRGVGVVAISPSSVKVEPQDGPEQMAADATRVRYPFPYLYDETQEVSRAFGPICIPDYFIFKKDEGKPFELVYHGQVDDSRSINSRPITYRDIKEALEAVLAGQPVDSVQKPNSGCPVKWHPEEGL